MYIRGIDFKLTNKKAAENGGFHAIITYQIESEADEIQAFGRVGRQGKSGSASMIISKNDLEIFNIEANEENLKDKIPERRK